MDDEYYRLVSASRVVINGIPIVSANCLIPLKARAWLDLTARRDAGDRHVKGDDIRKHRNDVFRLYQSLAPADRFTLPDRPRADLCAFLDRNHPESPDWPAIRAAVGKPLLPDVATVLDQMRAIFRLDG